MNKAHHSSFEKRGSGLIVNDCSFRAQAWNHPIISCHDAYESTWMLDLGNDIRSLSLHNKKLLAYSMGFCPHLRCQLGNVTASRNGECPTGHCFTKLENGMRSFGACCFHNDTFDSGDLIGVASRSQPTAKPIYKHSRVILQDKQDEFINANEIYPGLIVTQCPMQNSGELLEKMLTQLHNMTSSTATMWMQLAPPDMLNPTRHERYRDCYLLPSLLSSDVTVSMEANSEKAVERWQLPTITFTWFKHWQDFTIPSLQYEDEILKLALEAAEVMQRGSSVIVSCASGRGRSGSLAALIVALKQQITTHEELVNIIVEMRRHRDGLVETPQQYRFISRLAGLSDPAVCSLVCELRRIYDERLGKEGSFVLGMVCSLVIMCIVIAVRRIVIGSGKDKKKQS